MRAPTAWAVPHLVALLVLTGLLAVLPTGASPASAARYERSTSTYLTPAGPVGVAGPRIRLGYVKVPSPGTYHATLATTITDRSADPVQLVSVSLVCKEESLTRDQIGASANVVHGERFTLTARVYFHVRKRGACFAYGTTMGLVRSSAARTSRRVRANSTIVITGPVSSATRETTRFVDDDADRAFAGRSSLSRPGEYTHAGELATRARPGTRVLVTGNAYLTTCTAVGGSRDQTTNGRYLCTDDVVRRVAAGSLVRVRLVLRQYTPGGSVCHTAVVPGSTGLFRITAKRHHLPVGVHARTRVPDADPRCGTLLRAWTEVRVLRGPAVVVHFPSTVTSFRPI